MMLAILIFNSIDILLLGQYYWMKLKAYLTEVPISKDNDRPYI